MSDKNTFKGINSESLFAEMVGMPESMVDLWPLLPDGLQSGTINIVGSLPGMGATSFMLNVANFSGLKLGGPVLYVTLQRTSRLLASRILSIAFSGSQWRLPSDTILTGRWNATVTPLLDTIAERMRASKFRVEDDLFEVDNLLTKAEEWLSELANTDQTSKCCALLVIDDLHHLKTSNYGVPPDSRDHEMQIIMRKLRRFCNEQSSSGHPVALLASAQLNRSSGSPSGRNNPGGSGRYYLSDLRDSGSLENFADRAMFLHRPNYFVLSGGHKPGSEDLEIILTKNTLGKTGSVWVSFDRGTGLISKSTKGDDIRALEKEAEYVYNHIASQDPGIVTFASNANDRQ